MKNLLIIIFTLITITSCKKDNSDKNVEKVKLYIIADPGIYPIGTPTSIQISGTNIETVNNVTNIYIIEANYPKGETQTVTIKKIQGDPEMTLNVSKGYPWIPQIVLLMQPGKEL